MCSLGGLLIGMVGMAILASGGQSSQFEELVEENLRLKKRLKKLEK